MSPDKKRSMPESVDSGDRPRPAWMRLSGAGLELACPPLVEASIYMGNNTTGIHDLLGLLARITVPVVVLRARGRDPEDAAVMDFSKSPTWPGLAGAFPNGRDVYLPGLTHFIPMQDPELVARFVSDPWAEPPADAQED